MTTSLNLNPSPTTINMTSVRGVLGGSNQVLVYGMGAAWKIAKTHLRTQKDSPVARVFDYRMGDDSDDKDIDIEEVGPQDPTEMLDGRHFTQINSGIAHVHKNDEEEQEKAKTKRVCKTALTNWAFECWKRRGKSKQEQIPLVFVLDSDENRHHPTIENMLSKTAAANSLITHAEIRRLHKLCTDETIDKDLRKAVEKNAIFTRLTKRGSEWVLEKVQAPWKDRKWKTELANRKLQHVPKQKKYDWRQELNLAIAMERASNPTKWQRFTKAVSSLFS